MSDNIPFEIQMEIIQRIPDTKSLIQFRSVSKAWKSVIDSKDFVTAHTLRHDQAQPHLFISTRVWKYPEDRKSIESQVKYVPILDDNTFPHRKLSVFVPDSIDKFSSNDSIIVGSCHGLFCVYEDKTSTAVIWNPSIRKTVAIAVPNVLCNRYYRTVIGFGVCPSNLDPKLVKITYVSDLSKLQDVNASTRVEVFTLSSGGTWRSPLSGNLPHKSIAFGYSSAVVDGVIYWDAFDTVGGGFPKLIMSFDLTTEEFTKVNLPDCLALDPYADLSVSNLRESLAVLLVFNEYDLSTYHVWQMIGHGCTRSFNKLYSINSPDTAILSILGSRKSGAPIIEVEIDDVDSALAIYEPESESITNIGIHGISHSLFVHSYMETLLLLNH